LPRIRHRLYDHQARSRQSKRFAGTAKLILVLGELASLLLELLAHLLDQRRGLAGRLCRSTGGRPRMPSMRRMVPHSAHRRHRRMRCQRFTLA
jgi:hypothetical protein